MTQPTARHRPGGHHARRGQGRSSGSTASRSCRSSTTTAASRASSRSRTSRSARSTRTPPRTSGVGCGSAPRSASAPTRSSGPSALVDAGRRRARGRHRPRPLARRARRRCKEVTQPLRRRHHRRQRRHRRAPPRRCSMRAPTPSRSASAPAPSAPPGSSPASACRRSRPSTTAPRRPPATASASSPTAALQYSGDIAKAIAAGADAVMLGSLLAGVDESPGEVVLHQGERYKEYRGMGSMGAMKTRSFSKDRYFQGDVDRHRQARPRGHRGPGRLQGPASPTSSTNWSAASARPWATAAPTTHRRHARRGPSSCASPSAGLRESHPHDVTITKEAPNYNS